MYVLVQLAKGTLPWQYIKATNENNYKELMEAKIKIVPELLCRGLPEEFTQILTYILSLENGFDPDYKYIEDLFR